MIFNSLFPAVFINRPNRFLAHCLLGEEEIICHVPNTGRLKELLTPGASVYVEPSDSPERKTKYTLRLVKKGEHLVQIDSQAPNKLTEEALLSGVYNFFPSQPDLIKRESTYKNSRFDFFLMGTGRQGYLEVKGVTLERGGTAMFPDAPTPRGVKHIHELIEAKAQGLVAGILFVVQMDYAIGFGPNRDTHPEFADALLLASEAGVSIRAFGCDISLEGICLSRELPVHLD